MLSDPALLGADRSCVESCGNGRKEHASYREEHDRSVCPHVASSSEIDA